MDKELEMLTDLYCRLEDLILNKVQKLPSNGTDCICNSPTKFCITDSGKDDVSCFCLNCGGDIKDIDW